MKKHIIFLMFVLPLLGGVGVGYAQNRKIDSLQALLKTDKEDTNKVIHLYTLCRQYNNIGEYDKGLSYGKQALQLAENVIAGNDPQSQQTDGGSKPAMTSGGKGWKKGIAQSYHNIGVIYWKQGNYPEALKNYFASLKIWEELVNSSPNGGGREGAKKGIANSCNNIGLIYYNQGNYPEALKNYFASLKIREEIGDKQGIAGSYNNIGEVYMEQGKAHPNPSQKEGLFNEALKNYFAALKINETMGNKNWIAINYNNIGIIYDNQGNDHTNPSQKEGFFNEALKMYFASLKIREEIGDKNGIASSNINLGTLYTTLACHFEGGTTEKSKQQIPPYGRNDKNEMTKVAQTYLNKALQLSKEIGSKDRIKDSYAGLAVLDSTVGNYKLQIKDYKLYILYRDSLDNEETQKKTIQSSMSYEFEKKEIAAKAEQEKLDAFAKEEKQKQQLFLGLTALVLVLVLVFAVFMYSRFKITQRQKVVIEKQKALVDVKNKEIEEHQKEITDSINYAKRIQYSLFASNELLDKHLTASPNPHVESRVMAVSEPPSHQIAGQARNDVRDYFIFFKPKDIVSGDFYWATEYNNNFYFAVCDSTGHGVPGAFMSILNMGFLSEAIKEKDISKPNEILNYVRQRLIETISKEGQKDGMDCILIKLEYPSPLGSQGWDGRVRCEYAAANNEPILLRDGNIIELPKDRMPVGKGEKTNDFTLQTVELQKGDSLILYTDGYADQFGGDKGKKFKYKPLNELLLANQQRPCSEQKEILNTTLNNWKGNLEQVDDITLIGIKL